MRVAVSRFLQDMFAPPYRLLPLAVFLFAMLCCIVHPYGALRSGTFADPDDYMRLVETINWLQGQGWHDLAQPRLSPGAHTVVHWARLLDLPIAVLMLPLIKVMGIQNAAFVAALIVPPVTFGLLLWLACLLAKPFVGAERANLAAPMVLFAPLTLMNFVPGRVDHHGYEVLVGGFALLCLERMASSTLGLRWAVAAAVVLTCGLWIGTEALPWAILFVACLAVMAAWMGGDLLKRAAQFGIALVVSTVLVLPLAVPSAEYNSLALSWYSLADVVFGGLVAVLFLAAWLAGRSMANRPLRLALMAVLGIAVAAAFFLIVPEAMRGPFADYDDFDATIALANIGEAQPFVKGLHFSLHNYVQFGASLINLFQALLLPGLGFIAAGFAIHRAAPQKRLILLPHFVFLAAAIVLTLFCQMRVGWFMQFFAVAPLTWLLLAAWDKIGQKLEGRSRFAAEIATFLALGFAPAILLPALAHNSPVWSDVALFPAARAAPVCSLRDAAAYLDWAYADHPHTILAGSNEGPELLFRTPHQVIAGNFDVPGNRDVYDFFRVRDDAAAQAIAKKWKADLVLICRSFPLDYARLDHARPGRDAFLSPASDGRLHLTSDPNHLTLVERLVRGPLPDWLKPVEIPNDKDYLLFEVRE